MTQRSHALGWRALVALAPRLVEERLVEAFFTPRTRKAEPPRVEGHAARAFKVREGGEELAAWSFGEGPTVLLIHGWQSMGADLTAFVSPLVESGRRVVTFDHPAHGFSTGKQTSVVQMAGAVRALAEITGPLEGLVTHSLGSAATVLAMAQGLSVGRAVFVAPAIEPDVFIHKIAEACGLPDHERFLRRVYAWVGREPGTLSAAREATRFRVPALLFHDPADREVPFEHAARLAAAWPGATLEPLEGVGHRRIVRDPEVVHRTVAFLTGGAR